MNHFCLVELKQLLCKLLEPNPSHRLPLMDVEIHPWVTCDAKMPFYPFHAFPRDKLLKSQVSYYSRDVLFEFLHHALKSKWGRWVRELIFVKGAQIWGRGLITPSGTLCCQWDSPCFLLVMHTPTCVDNSLN